MKYIWQNNGTLLRERARERMAPRVPGDMGRLVTYLTERRERVREGSHYSVTLPIQA